MYIRKDGYYRLAKQQGYRSRASFKLIQLDNSYHLLRHGRIDDISGNGMELIQEIVTIFDNYLFPTEIIVASIRHPVHFVQSAMIGAHIATVPFNVLERLMKHPLTDRGIETFNKDWEKLKNALKK